jgi:hypothetical protein
MSWLSDASANRIIQSYTKNFVDVSGNFKVRNAITSSSGGSTVDTSSASWSQLGSDIDGEAAWDESGKSVSLSSDGTIVAIGAIYNDGNSSDAGHVRVYEYSGGSWSQLGSDIDGEAIYDESGISVSLSSDGTIVAIGATGNDGGGTRSGHVRVYEYSGGSWSQLGSDIDGEASNDRSGISVSLSSDGSIVAIGAYINDGNGSNAGHVRVYEYSGGSWSQLGSDIDGEAANDTSGYATSLSSDGTILAVGAYNNAGVNGSSSGHVRVYQWNGSSWSQLGSDIDGEAENDQSGRSVSLSSDGTILAVGAPYNDGTGTSAGHVRVYEYSGGSWSQLGSDIDGEAAGDAFGYSVSLSSDGTIVAIGGINNDGTPNNSGHVRVYEYSGGSWNQLGSDIDGEAGGDNSGFSISLSSDGTIVAIGAYGNDANGTRSGHVRVYGGGFGSSAGGSSVTTTSTTVLDVSGGTVNMLQNTMDISAGVVDINGTTWINRGQSGATIADAYQGALIIESNKTSSSDAVLHVETAGQTQAFSVRADGSMYSANTLRHSSDDRRKINEQYITNATETINKLSPQIYTKLNDLVQNGGTPTKTESGLIAQEIYYNAPELRHLVYIEDKNGNKLTPQEYDLSGTDIQNDPDYSALGWGNKSATVDYIGLIPYLIKSNQEQQETIDNKTQVLVDNKKTLEEDLQTRISALEA